MSVAVRLRPGRPAESAALSELAFRAKAHWGYDAAFMEACRAELTVSRDDFGRRLVVAELDGRVAGFAILDTSGDRAELVDLWVDPPCMGRGVGRRLWGDATAAAREAGHCELRVEADPHAAGFYEAMGACRVGEAPSDSIPGRMLPVLAMDL